VISYLFKQAFVGLYAIHAKMLSHSDIKAANIFLHYDGKENINLQVPRDLVRYNIRLILGDLGLASVYSLDKSYHHGKKGTPYYYSPEIWNERELT
jgi:serine/threonine protein kinase